MKVVKAMLLRCKSYAFIERKRPYSSITIYHFFYDEYRVGGKKRKGLMNLELF